MQKLDEGMGNFTREKAIIEWKSTIIEMKNSEDVFSNSLETIEDRISEQEFRPLENTQTEAQNKEWKIKKRV